MRVELRCPRTPRTKFADVVDGTGLVEVACRPCRKAVAAFSPPLLIVHVFEAATGRCINTDEIETPLNV